MEGIGGKGWSAEGDAPEKCATLGIIRGRGPQAKRSGRGRVATFSGASPPPTFKFSILPSSEVPADGPQTTEMGEIVVWGAGRWTSSAENLRKFIKVYCFSIKVFYICDKHNYNSHG